MRFHRNNLKSIKRGGKRASSFRRGRIKLVMLGMAVLATVASFLPMFNLQANVYARDYEAEIRALQNQINDYNKKASELAAHSDTLAGKIAELQNQQAEIQAQIDLSNAEKAQLEQQIADAEARIKRQAEALSQTLQDQYYSSQTSSLDILMNSKSVSDYIDRQTRQQSISDQITKTVNQINQEKQALQTKKTEVEKVIQRNAAQKKDLENSKAEQQRLLEQTQGQESKFRELTDANNAKIADLRAQQAAENAAKAEQWGGKFETSGQTCGGGYPVDGGGWGCGFAKDASVDPWGMYNRECVSYAAFKVASTYGWPSFWTKGGNNAYQWPAKARAYGMTVSSVPKPGTVAVSMAGYYGHVAWVESVSGDYVTVSQYNYDNMGNYSVMTVHKNYFDGGYIYYN